MFSIVKQKRVGNKMSIWNGFRLCAVASGSTFRRRQSQMNAPCFIFTYFPVCRALFSRRPTGENIEAGTVQSRDQHLEQLQSRCSSIVLTRKVEGHRCLCSCSSERRAAWMSVKRLCICTNLRGTDGARVTLRWYVRTLTHRHTCSHTLSTLFSLTFVLIC